MIILKCRSRFTHFIVSQVCRRCCSQLSSDVTDSTCNQLSAELEDSGIVGGNAVITSVKSKIIYSSVIHKYDILSWKEVRRLMKKEAEETRRERRKIMKDHVFPLSMKYVEEFCGTAATDGSFSVSPISIPTGEGNAGVLVSCSEGAQIVRTEGYGIDNVELSVPIPLPTSCSLESQKVDELVTKNHLKRNFACGGCGASIQCEDQYNPGFIPQEFLSSLNRRQESFLLCQRCYFTRSLKVSLQVNFNPSNYLKELGKLRNRRSLILAVFDVTDFSPNICSSISDVVGKGHPVILVGNKVDLLPPDSHRYLNRVRDHIREIFKSNGHLNVKDVFLISSASGIGIESLITKLFSIWKNYGDVYLVGHTNVGKSSLFNALLNSDLCKAMKAAGIQCATTSPWPGTTAGVLKFPMSRPAGMLIFQRMKRLQLEHIEKKLLKSEVSSSKKQKGYLASPDTFAVGDLEDINCEMGTSAVRRTLIPLSQEKLMHLGMSTRRRKDEEMRWCHDTPGIPNFERTLDLLTPDEMKYALPGSRMIIPRTFYVKVGLSIFIGGLARIDHNEGDKPICMTVFASRKLPVLVCAVADAEEMYATLLGTRLLCIPRGEQGRLKHWPPLACKTYEVTGLGWKESCADVLLSSAGWVAITAGRGMNCQIRAHTPRALGIELRTPSLMPYSVLQKGPRRTNSPVYPPLNDHLFTKYSS